MTEPLQDPDTLARRLDETLPPGLHDTPRSDPDPLVDMAVQIASQPQSDLPPAMVALIRSQVLEAHYNHRLKQAQRFGSLSHWAAIASIAVIFLVFGLTPIALASVPGDSLYAFKQAIEQAESLAATSQESQAFTHLLHASRRAQEAAALSGKGQLAPDLFAASLAEMAAAADLARSASAFSPATLLHLETETRQINMALNEILSEAQTAARVPESTLVPLMTDVWTTQNSGELLLPSATMTASPTPTTSPTATFTHTDTLTPTASATDAAAQTAPTNADATLVENQSLENENSDNSDWDEDADCDNPPPPQAPAQGWRARCEGAPMPLDTDDPQT